MDKLKQAIQAALPLLAILAALSPNKYDDTIVALLRSILNDPEALKQVHAAMQKQTA